MQQVCWEEEAAAAPLPLPELAFSFDDPQAGEEEEKKEKENERRKICWDGCGRPSSVCICPYLPPHPISTSTRIVILHHPHELRHNKKLSTLPSLTKCLLNSLPLPGRKLRLGSHPLLDSLYHNYTNSKALFLFPSFPSSSSIDLSQWASETPSSDRADPVLIVFDGTWKQAREMVTASLPFLSQFARHVSVGSCDATVEGLSTFDSELVLRKEPFLGCVSTMEAVARALRILEPDGVGVETEERLIEVLRAMVGFQACHLKPVKPRRRMRKKKEMMTMKEKQEDKDCCS